MSVIPPFSKEYFPPPPEKRARMVSWFDPRQLMQTALQVIASTAFGRRSDRRLLDAVVHPKVEPCDHSKENEIWIDYVSDTGDGWNSTYAVAQAVAQPELEVECDGKKFLTERGSVLVFGGDEVYPTASRDEYQKRLIGPYETALPETPEGHSPSVFALAGNHDWYDSLVAFSRLFCGTKSRWLGGWKTEQALSYFAIKLPHDWWIVAVDIQLDSDIDDPQLEYFKSIAALMSPGARIILCTAEPHWIYEARYKEIDDTVFTRNFEYLEKHVFENQITVTLSGDLHHYRRHADPTTNKQLITAGGGGAFLYPTHADIDLVKVVSGTYEHKASFPKPEVSRKMTWRNLVFPVLNPAFGFATSLLYVLIAWSVNADVGLFGISDAKSAFAAAIKGALNNQLAVLWILLVIGGFYFFTETHSARYKFFAGITHALTHLLAVFLLGWMATYVTHQINPAWQFGDTPQLLTAGAIIAVTGYFAGAFIMGAYLLISLNVFGRHAGEFSSLHAEDYKSWLRIHITTTGQLRIYPIGIEHVAKKWRERTTAEKTQTPSLLLPDDPNATRPNLIEAPIIVG